MTPANLKTVVWMLLVGTGILHLAVAGLAPPTGLATPLAAFGAMYFGIGLWVRVGGRTAILIALAVTLLGVTLGGSNFLRNGGPITLPAMFLIDFIVIAASAIWLIKTGKRG